LCGASDGLQTPALAAIRKAEHRSLSSDAFRANSAAGVTATSIAAAN
jgi:hypothetical protein